MTYVIRITVNEITDAGSVTSVVWRDVKPNPFRTRLPKFWVPPLGILIV